jgi:hypothetical protein
VLSRLDKTNSSNIWVGGDFNLGNIDWSIPSFITGKPDAKKHHQLLDIIADHNLHQVTFNPIGFLVFYYFSWCFSDSL